MPLSLSLCRLAVVAAILTFFAIHSSSESHTLSNVVIPGNATSILVLLEGTGGEATVGVGSLIAEDQPVKTVVFINLVIFHDFLLS